MSDKLYPIGEFAAMNKISARMLRHYDKIGLLKPAAVAENGYRLYSSSQITVAALIRKYRACEFSLEEIRVLLMKEDHLSKLAKNKIRELNTLEATHTDALHRLRELSGINQTAHFNNPYEISHTTRNSQLLCISAYCGEDQIEQEFDALYTYLETVGLQPDGLSTLLCDLADEDTYRAAVSIAGEPIEGMYAFERTEAGHYISTFHYGDYYEIAAAYDRLLLYMDQNGLRGKGVFFERYFLDSTHTAYPAEYITELSIQITS